MQVFVENNVSECQNMYDNRIKRTFFELQQVNRRNDASANTI